jgi:hypothetical protein
MFLIQLWFSGKYIFARVNLRDLLCKIEVSMLVTMKNAAFLDLMLCGSCKNRCFRAERSSELTIT